MSNLEDKLLQIIKHDWGYRGGPDEAVHKIRQAFREDYWLPPIVYTSHGQKIQFGPNYMTGQEWLDRLEGELKKDLRYTYGNMRERFMACAKRAAGLDDRL